MYYNVLQVEFHLPTPLAAAPPAPLARRCPTQAPAPGAPLLPFQGGELQLSHNVLYDVRSSMEIEELEYERHEELVEVARQAEWPYCS